MEINAKEEIWKVIHTLFVNKKIQLMNKFGKSFPAEVEVWQDCLKVKSPGAHQNSPIRLLMQRYENKIFICETKVKGISGEGALILEPLKVNIRQETIEDTKEYIAPKLFVSGVISLADITVFLGDDQIKDLVKYHSRRLNHLFDVYNVHLSDKLDERMRLMRAFDLPIIVPNREDSLSVPDISVPHHEYVKSIRADKAPLDFKAEISVPIKYRQFIIIGYVQVFQKSRLDLNSYNLVSLVASSIKKDISDYKNHEESKEMCQVTQFSTTEITFLHSMNKHFSRIFHIGSQVIFNILVNRDIKITVRASVKNISPLDKFFSVTCEYHNLTLVQLEKLEELVEQSGFNS
jgi:hypothetical protein